MNEPGRGALEYEEDLERMEIELSTDVTIDGRSQTKEFVKKALGGCGNFFVYKQAFAILFGIIIPDMKVSSIRKKWKMAGFDNGYHGWFITHKHAHNHHHVNNTSPTITTHTNTLPMCVHSIDESVSFCKTFVDS